MASSPPRAPLAGGFLLALGAIGGPLVGALFGQATLGFFVGLGGATVLALAIWLRDRG